MANVEQSEKRICFAVDADKKEFLNEKLAWGDLKKIYSVLTDQLIEMLKEHDSEVVRTGIVSSNIPLTKLLEFSKKVSDEDATKGS